MQESNLLIHPFNGRHHIAQTALRFDNTSNPELRFSQLFDAYGSIITSRIVCSCSINGLRAVGSGLLIRRAAIQQQNGLREMAIFSAFA